MMQDSIDRTLERVSSLQRVRKAAKEPFAHDVFDALVELGVPGILIPEKFGGLGLTLLDAALAAEMLGKHVAPVPFVASAVMAPLALIGAGSDAQKAEWLPKLARGEVIGVAVSEHASGAREKAQVTARNGKLSGKALFVLDFNGADIFIVADKFGDLHLVDAKAKGLEKTLLTTIDATRAIGELNFDNVEAEPLTGGNAPATLDRMIDAGRIMLAADTLGAGERMIEKAVAYAKERKQFGRVIGSFQAVKHMCAEMAAELEPCRALIWYAAYGFDAQPGPVAPPRRPRQGASVRDRLLRRPHRDRSAWRHGLHRSARPALLVQAHRLQPADPRRPGKGPPRRGCRAGVGGELAPETFLRRHTYRAQRLLGSRPSWLERICMSSTDAAQTPSARIPAWLRTALGFSPEGPHYFFYRHSLLVRATHWFNAIVLFVMLMSGLQIFNAHPALYWGQDVRLRSSPLLSLTAEGATAQCHCTASRRSAIGRFDTTGVFGASDRWTAWPRARLSRLGDAARVPMAGDGARCGISSSPGCS